MDDITGNRLFIETDALEALTCEANRADARDRSLGRLRCSLCGSPSGWERWDRWQVEQARDSLLLTFAVQLTTRWGETIARRLDACHDWPTRGKLIKALREGTPCNPLPTFYCRNDDDEHLYTRCEQCNPSADGAVAVGAEEVQAWLEE